MEAGGSVQFSRWIGGPRLEKGVELSANSGADKSKNGGWGGSQDTEGDGDDP